MDSLKMHCRLPPSICHRSGFKRFALPSRRNHTWLRGGMLEDSGRQFSMQPYAHKDATTLVFIEAITARATVTYFSRAMRRQQVISTRSARPRPIFGGDD